MFGNSHVLMGGDDGDTGGGGSDRNTEAVRISERSFQSPSTTGGSIGREDTFKRSVSPASQSFTKGMAQLTGAALGVPGAGRFLVSRVPSAVETDASGRRLGGNAPSGLDKDSAADRARGFSQFGGFADNSNTGGRNVASAQQLATQRADLAINRALGFQEAAAGKAETTLGESRTAALAALQGGADRGISALSPFSQAGETALDRELAFLGLSGANAEQAALQGFTQSPGAAFAQQEEEQAIIRNALALGDVGGGRVKDELATRASGRFAQTLDSRLNRLSVLSGRGQQAAGGIANIETGLGAGQANIQQNTGANLSNLFLGTGENQAAAVLGQQVAGASAASEANRIAAQERQQKSQQDAAFQSQLFGLGASIAKPFISSFF